MLKRMNTSEKNIEFKAILTHKEFLALYMALYWIAYSIDSRLDEPQKEIIQRLIHELENV